MDDVDGELLEDPSWGDLDALDWKSPLEHARLQEHTSIPLFEESSVTRLEATVLMLNMF